MSHYRRHTNVGSWRNIYITIPPQLFSIHRNIYLSFAGLTGIDCIQQIDCILDNMLVQSITGRQLVLFYKLQGGNNPRNIKLPFPRVMLSQVNISLIFNIQLGGKRSKSIQQKIKQCYRSILTQVIIGDLVDDILDYIGELSTPGHIDVSFENEQTSSDMENNIRHGINTIMIQQHMESLPTLFKKGEIDKTVSLSYFRGLAEKIIFVFRYPDGNNSEILDILHRGILVIHGFEHSRFNNNMALTLDKMKFNHHIPNKAIYTVTFDPGPDQERHYPEIHLKSQTRSHFNLSGLSVELMIEIQPQDRDVILEVFLNKTNFLVTNGISHRSHLHYKY